MASLSTSKSGARRVIAKVDGKRRPIYLGRLEKRQAETVRAYVAKLETAQQTGSDIDPDTQRWLGKINDELRGKLANVGLVPEADRTTLAEHIDTYIEGRTDLKTSTVKQLQQARKNLVDFFGEDKLLRKIGKADAEDWNRWLSEHEGIGDNTRARRVGRARQFWNRAIKKGIVRNDPFKGIRCTVSSNEDKFHFVTREDYGKLLTACPDAQWRAIIALCRIGGLRCTSEVLALKWDDILWDQDRLVVSVPKLEHIEGRETRICPLFPELREVLAELLELAQDGDVHVITRYRDPKQNPRTTFKKIIKRAGLVPWPKPFQNLRASRSTELEDQFPTHVAAKWLGHSPQIARQHYHMVHDQHFERAIRLGEAARQAARAASVGDGIASCEGKGAEEAGSQNPLKNKEIRHNTTESAQKTPSDAERVNAPRRTRTYDPLIKSQLLCQLS